MSHVPLYLDILGHVLDNHQNFLKKFGNLETKLLTYDTEPIKIEKPIFISGLARSGSTILLEILASQHNVTSHQYRDYPFIHIPYFWQTLKALIPLPDKKTERAHKDGLIVNSTSPEAMDEILWMSFFDQLHNPIQNNIIGSEQENEEFNNFYKHNILKILYGRKAKRFTSKNNYNITRINYLLKLFPDAKIILPIRKPEEHIYSLLKQNALFRKEQNNDPRSQRYTRRQGHFEFGSDFRPINTGNNQTTQTILNCWKKENFLKSYALYWSNIYEYIWNIAQNNKSVHIVRYDDLCNTPNKEINKLLEFCELNSDPETKNWITKIKAPDYYTLDLSNKEKEIIKKHTQKIETLYWDK